VYHFNLINTDEHFYIRIKNLLAVENKEECQRYCDMEHIVPDGLPSVPIIVEGGD
jgi:hypothetical protein